MRVAMNMSEGNLAVRIEMVLGGVGVAATASNTRFEIVTSGSGPIDHAGNCMSYLARLGMPNVCWMKSFWYRCATPMAERIAPVA